MKRSEDFTAAENIPHAEVIEKILVFLREAVSRHYGERLVSLVVYGSVGRGTPRPDSDVDLLVVAENLPGGRLKRMEEFRPLEKAYEAFIETGAGGRLWMDLSPVIKSPDEVRAGSPLFLDMIEDARILYDRNGFFEREREGLRERLRRLGARRIWIGSAWYWDLKPDYIPGEEFTL